ncbi:hypothetical protein GYMLUDRAFT_665120 [Collybiopsis luxurians FD-317 M1]|uniref:UEV domain-containing protein n=1 Tax=Collybiopsis luxurians FD-317 M1 TaxID=944289 RepID=A0A0D0CML2_9AGAR|nr:hypothetical protein GYMLUDRAFT_665120 [Collybiopsis luxurians FD-317 M1]
MTTTTTSTQKWLRENSAKYEQRDNVYHQVDQALATFGLYGGSNGWLKVKSDVYTYDDGRTHLLLCLHGLLPINFRNSTYHIPIDIWIPFNYPRSSPIVYVVPAQGMLIKNSRYVELSGKCDVSNYEGTKGSWLDRGEKTTTARTGLLGLIDALMNWFSRDPPVYSKAAQLSASSSPARSPLPTSIPHQVAQPPPPTYSPSPSRPSPIPPAAWTPQPPPIPQVPSASPAQQPVPPPPPMSWTPGPPPPLRIQSAPPPPPPLPPIPAQNLLDSDEPASSSQIAPAPPRPPNPVLLSLHSSVHAKLTAALQSLQSSLHHSSEHFRKMQQDLLRGEPAIHDEMSRLEAVKAVSLNVGNRLRQSVDAAERNIQLLRDKGDVSVDELICGPTIVHNQLINLVAEDNAIEDTIYHLHRALNSGSIDLDRFLKGRVSLKPEPLISSCRQPKPVYSSDYFFGNHSLTCLVIDNSRFG